MNIKVNSERSAAVNQTTFWVPIAESKPPVGVKLLLINERNGVAVLGTYSEKHQWTHWQGLPKFAESGLAQAASEPKMHGQWICEYPGDVFVVFDPMTDAAGILGAARSLQAAETLLARCDEQMPAYLLRDLAHDIYVDVPDLIVAIREAGLGNYSVNMALPAKVCVALCKWFAVVPNPPREPLTDKEILHRDPGEEGGVWSYEDQRYFARAVERTHEIGGAT